MELVIQKKEFVKGLNLTQSIVERKSIMEVLSNAYLEAGKDNLLTIIATDLEIGVKVDVQAEVKAEGKVLINAKKLNDIVKEVPAQEVKLKVLENNWVEIKSGSSKFKVYGSSTDEYPSLPDFDEKPEGEMDGGVLKEMLEKTIFSVSMDENRYNLGGIFMDLVEVKGKKRLMMVSTDGHRLSKVEREIDLKGGAMMGRSIILPRRGAEQILKMSGLEGEKIGFSFKENNGTVKSKNSVLMMRLVEGEFPDYNQVIPKESKKKVVIKREEFLSALKRSNVLLSNKYRGVKLSFDKGVMTMVTTNPDIGEHVEELAVEYKGDKIEILFDVKYLFDISGICRTDEIILSLNDSDSPGMLTEKGDPDYIHVIMPMLI
jgi:DNA polymerase-3 subunit beta